MHWNPCDAVLSLASTSPVITLLVRDPLALVSTYLPIFLNHLSLLFRHPSPTTMWSEWFLPQSFHPTLTERSPVNGSSTSPVLSTSKLTNDNAKRWISVLIRWHLWHLHNCALIQIGSVGMLSKIFARFRLCQCSFSLREQSLPFNSDAHRAELNQSTALMHGLLSYKPFGLQAVEKEISLPTTQPNIIT